MKKILSTVLALCLILGCVAAGFTAQAASEADLQAGINAAIANGTGEYNWTGGNLQLTKTLTINGDVKVNFNGATILGAPHKNTIYIGGGNVELINADVEGTSAKYHYIDGFIDEVKDACPTILIGNANVTLTDFVVTGAYVRIVGTDPNTGEKIPMSDAITMGNANAVLNLNNVRAFGNNGVENLYGSKVNVVDCLVGGYINDFYSDANVSFADGTTQYSGYDLFVEALADQITLTAGEADLISKVLGRWLEVTASVKNQNYVEPTYSYDADTDTLTVTATADKSYDVQAKCAFDYYYVPKTATILGETEDFVKTGALTYTATFENVPGNTVCDTDLIYKLGVGMGGDAQAMVDDALDMLESVINMIPGVIEKFAGEQTDAIDEYLTGEQGYATLLWNAYNELGIDSLLADYDTQITNYQNQINQMPDGADKEEAQAQLDAVIAEKAAAEADIKSLFGPVFDICGASLKKSAQLNSALAGVANGTYTETSTGQDLVKYNRAKTEITSMNEKFGCHLDFTTGAKGYIDRYLEYFNTVKDLAVTNGKLNGGNMKALGEYVGANYLGFYDLLKEMGECAHNLANILTNPDGFIGDFLADSNVDLSQYTGLISMALDYIDKGFAYVDRLLNSSTYTNLVNNYNVPAMCGIYLDKAYTIATNPTTYFDIETDGTLIEGFEFPQDATYTTPADVEMVKVKVATSGYGKYAVDGVEYTTKQTFEVPMGSTFTASPVEMGSETLFKYYVLSDAKGNDKLSPTGGTLTVYSDTYLTLFFVSDSSKPEVTFMTNYELSSKWLDTYTIVSDEEIDALPEVPAFEGAEFLGWATENVSGAAAEAAGILMNDAQVLALTNAANTSTTFYAIFKFDQLPIAAELFDSTVAMTDNFVSNHKAYFSFLFNNEALDSGDVIVECGVLAAGTPDAIEGATPNGGSGIIKGNVNLSAYNLPMVYTYGVSFKNHSTDRTAYAKGFVTIRHSDGTYTTEYSEIYSLVIAAYTD